MPDMEKLLNVTDARYVGSYVLWLRFNDGSEGKVDLADELEGEVFGPLRDTSYFSRVQFNPDLRTVSWPNGADFAPEFLYSLLNLETVAA